MATALAMPLLMCASGIYAAGDAWWRRRRRSSASYVQVRRDRAAERAVAVAEAVVADEYALLVADGADADAKTSGMRHHERPVTDDRVAEGRSGEAA
ncbi:hypothetical protein OKJ48_39740 [Streptomyces kunmingensis]|uniref:Secreted protein n=1 Tax=Streptomyces kunmingensis TaxID=68225 RepID=A0ABU6CQK5_9ACTN|nr:hypothetical protein [Streptomyces kunmingensis]MEB3966317.1 hypothetical protein [Streptomyces kunmingensis]